MMEKQRANRQAMPLVAAMVDELRASIGADWVNVAMATGMAAAREHAQVLAEHGPAAAARWHRANAHRCTFVATEAGRTIGLPSPYGAQPYAAQAPTERPTPLVGTPGRVGLAGNSAPVGVLVAGPGKSERVGEQRPACGGVHHG